MKIWKAVLLLGVITVCIVVAFFVISPTQKAKADIVLELAVPQFVTQAQANSIDSYIGDKLDDEAGISAYFKAPDAIDLDNVRGAFRVIEEETGEYIIGSIEVPEYAEHYDVHVYVNINGWILAYYLRPDNVGKIVDIYHGTVGSTNFTTVIATVAAAAGAPFTEATYYDFRYPNATNMILIYEDEDNGRDFTIKLPPEYGYYERGFATHYGNFILDGVDIPPVFNYNYMTHGSISAGQLMPDVTHAIEVGYLGALAIIYRVP